MNNKTYKDLVELLSTYFTEKDFKLLDKYYAEALNVYDGLIRYDEDYIIHPINVAYKLAEIKMDVVTIGSALLHEAVLLDKMTIDEIEKEFGSETSQIISCTTKISSLKKTFNKEKNEQRYRRIIVGLADNPKALFIKFADRLHNFRYLNLRTKKEQKEVVEDTENILIPIAHRLGVKNMKSELEDYCLKFKDSKGYQTILHKLSASREELESSLNEIRLEIIEMLDENNIKYEILSRVKSVCGVYNKLSAGKKWEEIYDLLGLRILVNKIEECYLVIGLIHSRYNSIPTRFKDYIANPKSNMYQSIHTTIFGNDGKIYEIQVRTFSMDEIAEKGVASHWSYKERIDGKVKTTVDERLEAFRSLIEKQDLEKNKKFFSFFNKEITKQEIYVFTPKGDIIELPTGSTPIDFAYKIHTAVGDSTVSATVNGKMVKLDYKLKDDDIVSVNTQDGKGPSRDWLKFVKTDQAKNRIKSYFYKNERVKYVQIGKEMLSVEAKKNNYEINSKDLEKIVKDLKIDSIDELYFSVSILKLFPKTVINKMISYNKEKLTNLKKSNKIEVKSNTNDIVVEGYSNIKTSLAPCCSPVFGEEIVGYVTKGYGIKIHSKKCKNLNLNSERIINCSWGESNPLKSLVTLKIIIDGQKDRMLEIVTVSSKLNVSVDSINLNKNVKAEPYYLLKARIDNIDVLNKLLDELLLLDFVLDVVRVYI